MPYKNLDEQRAYQKHWVAARRKLWFRNKSCARCGSTENLELDHIDPEHKITHKIWSYSWANIAKETAKCQVLCHDCHWKKTRDEDMKYPGMEHGTVKGYDYYGCRCDKCRRIHNDKVNAWRWKTGKRKKRGSWNYAIKEGSVKVLKEEKRLSVETNI